jgi:hypothetical protein
MAGLGYTPTGAASPQYRSGIRLKRDRAFSEFLTTTGLPTPWLAKAQMNFQFAGPLGAGRVDVTLTSAQLLTLAPAGIINLIPAVAGQTYVLEGPIFFRYTFGGTGYLPGNSNIIIQYTTGAGAVDIAGSVALSSGQLAAASTENIVNALPNSATNITPVIGDGVGINASIALTTGNGTLRVAFTYLMY